MTDWGVEAIARAANGLQSKLFDNTESSCSSASPPASIGSCHVAVGYGSQNRAGHPLGFCIQRIFASTQGFNELESLADAYGPDGYGGSQLALRATAGLV